MIAGTKTTLVEDLRRLCSRHDLYYDVHSSKGKLDEDPDVYFEQSHRNIRLIVAMTYFAITGDDEGTVNISYKAHMTGRASSHFPNIFQTPLGSIAFRLQWNGILDPKRIHHHYGYTRGIAIPDEALLTITNVPFQIRDSKKEKPRFLVDLLRLSSMQNL